MEDEYVEPRPTDVVCQRTQALRDLAASVDETADKQAKALLIKAMERLVGCMIATDAKSGVTLAYNGKPAE